jgi:hypothetical protein
VAAGQDTRFSCSCGTISGHIRNLSAETARRALCFCPDCRAAERFLGQPDPGGDGVPLAQLAPADIVFETGLEHLAVMRLYPTGLMRWYADCCKAPLFNTVATPMVCFATILLNRLEHPERAGPVRAKAFVPRPGKKPRHQGARHLIWPVLARSLSALMTGAWRDTPFFDRATGKPVRVPRVLSQEERRALGLGPKV